MLEVGIKNACYCYPPIMLDKYYHGHKADVVAVQCAFCHFCVLSVMIGNIKMKHSMYWPTFIRTCNLLIASLGTLRIYYSICLLLPFIIACGL